MDLLLDAGNSRLKAAVGDGLTLIPLAPLDWAEALPDPTPVWGPLQRPDRILCANVAGARRAEQIAAWANRCWGLPLRLLRVGAAAAGVRNRYGRPEQLGIDRWLAAVAGYNHVRHAVCVIDCGTAVNVEFVTADADYLGGLIAPGLRLMSESLSRGTAALPLTSLSAGHRIGRDTASCLSAGIAHALGGLIDRIVATARTELATEPAWLMTGGDAALLAALSPITFEVIPDLVLRGIVLAQGDG
ncbi:MAG: type III pantothenate kinase [Gammaproteobacteria bacterium]|nr:type III pantothenate kinase [Gammaproteobacteria bacterium]